MRSEKEREGLKRTYEFLKQRGICTRCNKEYAEPGKTMCPSCIEKQIIYNRTKKYANPERRIKMLQQKRKKYYELKASGICPYCRKKELYVHNGKTYGACYECYLYRKRKRAEYGENHKKRYREDGLCIRCGDKCVDGKKLCKFHLEELKERGMKGAKALQEKKSGGYNHPWEIQETMRINSLKARSEFKSSEKSIPQNGL